MMINLRICLYDRKFRNNKKVKIFKIKSQKKNIASFDAINGYLQLFNKSKGKIMMFIR